MLINLNQNSEVPNFSGLFFCPFAMKKIANRTQNIQEYYFSRKLEQVRKFDSKELPLINLGIGSPDLPPPKEVVERLCSSASRAGVHGYQPYRGLLALRQGISAFYRTWYGIDLSPENEILPLMGSKEGITHITQAYVNEGDIVVVPDPGYPSYASAANLVGAEVRTYRISEATDWKLDMSDFMQLPLDRVKLVWVNFPHMPTGAGTDKEGIKSLINLARKHHFLIVSDNPYSFIQNPEPFSIFSIEHAFGHCLELGSLSKSHNMAGWRVGWLAGDSAAIAPVLKVRSLQDSGMFLPVQEAAVAALEQPGEWFTALNAVYSARKKYFMKLLEVMDCAVRPHQNGMFLWAKVPDRIQDVEGWLDEFLYSCHLFITPGVIFGKEGNRYLRVSLCTPESKISEAIQRVEEMKIRGILSKEQIV
jgi:aspartate/methionine/tyrosine aminotransferase